MDELKKYGRRRPPHNIKYKDNISLDIGEIEPYKTEYKRKYKFYDLSNYNSNLTKLQSFSNKRENSPNFQEDLFFFLPDYKLTYKKYPRRKLQIPSNKLEPLIIDYPMDYTTEKNSQYILYPNSEKRKLLRRSTALKLEGDMANETEVRKEYVIYPNAERPQMIRRLPSLKLEGEFESMTTEQQDKYISYLLSRRPIMEKKKTLLKMDGDFDFLTENNVSYVAHDTPRRPPPIRKRSTSLKLDGDFEFSPEYRDSYVNFNRSRPVTYKPKETLKNNGEKFENLTEMKTQFVNFENVQIPQSAKPENNLHVGGEMEILPEYKVNYIDFPRERPFIRKPFNQIKPEGNLQILNENSKEKFSAFSPTAAVTDAATAAAASAVEKSENLKQVENNQEMIISSSDKNKSSEKLGDDVKTMPPPLLPPPPSTIDKNIESNAKIDKFGFTIFDKDVKRERRPSSLKLDGEFLFLPQLKVSETRSRDNMLKPVKNFKSNPTSPRKKQKDKIKFKLEDDNMFLSETILNERLNVKKLKENSRKNLEKNIKFDLPVKSQNLVPDDNFVLPGQKTEKFDNNNLTKLEDYLSGPPKEFQAFQVLDVKGQNGCQKLNGGDYFNCDKLTSDDEHSTYRLEVTSSPEKKNYLNKRKIM